MSYAVDFNTVSTIGLESSPVSAALAGLRANEARYFKNKYDHSFVVQPASDASTTIEWVRGILETERKLVIASRPLEATAFQVENLRIAYVFYESGLSINVMYAVDNPKKRAVGFKLAEGMEVPAELATRFKFATQKSKLAGKIRGSFFVIKGEYLPGSRAPAGTEWGESEEFLSAAVQWRAPVESDTRHHALRGAADDETKPFAGAGRLEAHRQRNQPFRFPGWLDPPL